MLCAGAVLLWGGAAPASAERQEDRVYPLGDVNRTGSIDYFDVYLTLRQFQRSFLLALPFEEYLLREHEVLLADILGDYGQEGNSSRYPYPGYTSEYGSYVDTRVDLSDVMYVCEYYTHRFLLKESDFTWADMFADDPDALYALFTLDRGDYYVRWDDSYGEYVLAPKSEKQKEE